MLFTVAAAVTLLMPAAGLAQDIRAYVVRLGSDTLSLEQVTRTATQVRGEYVTRTPRSSHRIYTLDLNPDGTVKHYDLVLHNLGPGQGPMDSHTTVDFTADSAIAVVPRGDSTFTMRTATGKGAVPLLNGVMGLLEQIGRQAKASGAKVDTLPIVAAGNPTLRGIVTKAGKDTQSVIIETSAGKVGPYRFGLDSKGRLAWFSGVGSTFQAEAKAVPSVDLAAATASYTAHPLGQLSARDTVRSTVAGSELWVDYGRPSKRNRDVFGGVVPWNTVWRTGANAATQFHTGADLDIGGLAVPAGTYTLWTLPSPTGWKLIVNKQTGQWGTEYHQDQDLGRVDLKVEPMPQPMETFTIAIEPQGDAATLKMSWDKTSVSVPMKKK